MALEQKKRKNKNIVNKRSKKGTGEQKWFVEIDVEMKEDKHLDVGRDKSKKLQ